MSEPGLKVAILCPAYDGRAHLAHNRCVRGLLHALRERGDHVVYIDACHCANLPRLRNMLAAKALEWGADVLLWLDSDVAVSVAQALRLIDSGHDLVGVLPQSRITQYPEPPRVPLAPKADGSMALRSDDFIEVGKVPTACLVTRRAVYERLREAGIAKRLRNRSEGEEGNPWFRNFFWYELEPVGQIDGEDAFDDDGEDYYFCRKARDLGFTPLIDAKGRVLHHEGRARLPLSFWDIHGQAFEVSNGDQE